MHVDVSLCLSRIVGAEDPTHRLFLYSLVLDAYFCEYHISSCLSVSLKFYIRASVCVCLFWLSHCFSLNGTTNTPIVLCYLVRLTSLSTTYLCVCTVSRSVRLFRFVSAVFLSELNNQRADTSCCIPLCRGLHNYVHITSVWVSVCVRFG